MARRRRSSGAAARIVRVPAARSSSPVIKIAAPRAPSVRRQRRRRRAGGRARSIVGGALGSGIDVAIGGALFGFAVKQGWVQKLPAIPIIGRTGTAAILLHFWARRGGGDMVRKAANAAAVIAGYQLGSTGAITGDNAPMTSSGYDYDAAYADGDDDLEGDDDDD